MQKPYKDKLKLFIEKRKTNSIEKLLGIIPSTKKKKFKLKLNHQQDMKQHLDRLFVRNRSNTPEKQQLQRQSYEHLKNPASTNNRPLTGITIAAFNNMLDSPRNEKIPSSTRSQSVMSAQFSIIGPARNPKSIIAKSQHSTVLPTNKPQRVESFQEKSILNHKIGQSSLNPFNMPTPLQEYLNKWNPIFEFERVTFENFLFNRWIQNVVEQRTLQADYTSVKQPLIDEQLPKRLAIRKNYESCQNWRISLPTPTKIISIQSYIQKIKTPRQQFGQGKIKQYSEQLFQMKKRREEEDLIEFDDFYQRVILIKRFKAKLRFFLIRAYRLQLCGEELVEFIKSHSHQSFQCGGSFAFLKKVRNGQVQGCDQLLQQNPNLIYEFDYVSVLIKQQVFFSSAKQPYTLALIKIIFRWLILFYQRALIQKLITFRCKRVYKSHWHLGT